MRRKYSVIFTRLCLTICIITTVSANQLPNIIFILTDDQGYADIGYHGSPIPTPNLDALAKDGIKLENYYVHPMCSPSRAALMTGRFAANVQISEFPIPPGGVQGLDDKFTTLPQALKEFGYMNHIVGKWHLGHAKKKYLPTRKGFDSFLGTHGLGINHISKQVSNGIYDFFENEEVYWDNTTHATKIFGTRAVQIIEQQAKQKSMRPMFLYLAFTAPHDPLVAEDEDLSVCSHIQNQIRRTYCGMVHGVDRHVGYVLEALERTKLIDNTIIVFSSDNGGIPWSGGFNYPFRGAKMTPLEGGVRVPAFIYGPKFLKEKSGSTYNGLFHIADWYPTLLGFVKSQLPPGSKTKIKTPKLDGVDQHESLIGEAETFPRDRLMIHHSAMHKSHVYRRGPWKLILGQHGIPIADIEIYKEPESWLIDGNFGDTFAETAIWFLHSIFGMENSLGSFRAIIGTIANRFHPWYDEGADMIKLRDDRDVKIIFRDVKFQDLLSWAPTIESISPNETRYPTVALYNVEKDPGEEKNLAYAKKQLVQKLIKEAAKLLDKDGLPLYVGDSEDIQSPKVASLSSIFQQSSSLDQVEPCSPWLEDDYDLRDFPTDRITYYLGGNNANSIAFQMGIIFAIWALTPILFMYLLVLCC